MSAANRTVDDAAETHARSIIADAARIRMVDFFRRTDDRVVHRSRPRHGIVAVVARTTELREDELLQLLQFRTAQYLAVDMIDARVVHAAGVRHDPIDGVKERDVHVVVGSPDTGEIYSSIWVRCMPDMPPGATLRTRERPSISKEEIFGRGVYDHLRILPDLPLAKIRDAGRFIKNQALSPFGAASLRAPMEAGVAFLRAILGPLREEIQAIVGDVEEGVSDRHLDYLHVPTVLVRGVLPCVRDDAWLYRRYLERRCYPYAAVMTDTDPFARRVVQIEAALELPGTDAARRLVELGREPCPSSLLDAGEPLSKLMSIVLPQVGVPMDERRRSVAFAERLRALPAFASLSMPEATTLGRLMSRHEIEEGETFVGTGDAELVLVEEGSALTWVRYPHGGASAPREIGRGEIVGQVALVTDGACFEEGRARSPMVVWRLPGETYRQLLADAPAVDRAIARDAASALAASLDQASVVRMGSGFQARRARAAG